MLRYHGVFGLINIRARALDGQNIIPVRSRAVVFGVPLKLYVYCVHTYVGCTCTVVLCPGDGHRSPVRVDVP